MINAALLPLVAGSLWALLSCIPWLYIAFSHPPALSEPAYHYVSASVGGSGSAVSGASAISSWLRLEGHDKLLLTHHWARTDQERHQRWKRGKVNWRTTGQIWSNRVPCWALGRSNTWNGVTHKCVNMDVGLLYSIGSEKVLSCGQKQMCDF